MFIFLFYGAIMTREYTIAIATAEQLRNECKAHHEKSGRERPCEITE